MSTDVFFFCLYLIHLITINYSDCYINVRVIIFLTLLNVK